MDKVTVKFVGVSLTVSRYTFEPHHGRICDTAKKS